MPDMSIDMEDPRVYSTRVEPAHAPLAALAEASLAATAARAEEIDRTLSKSVLEHLRSGRALLIADAIAAAPSPAIARALWRCLIAAWSLSWRDQGGIAAMQFALPVVVVAGCDAAATEKTEPALPGVLRDTERLAAILREHRALRGNQAFALAPTLVSSDAIDVYRFGELIARQRLGDTPNDQEFPPAPIALQSGQQTVHLRFLMGTALAAPDADLLAGSEVGAWGMPLALELARQLSVPDVSVLALPRAPLPPPAALQQGRVAQREVGAQLFASNAIRRMRATVGEPIGVISAHRCAAAPGGGELRLSLSSPFDPRQSEGFRCPLFPTDRAGDVAGMLCDLLHDCRVTDVRVLPGVHPDRDPRTGMLLLFKAAAEGLEPTLH